MALRMFLLCRISRAAIMSVMRMLREREIEKYGTSKCPTTKSQSMDPDVEIWL